MCGEGGAGGAAVTQPQVPPAPATITKGASLADLLNAAAVRQLATNIGVAWPEFDGPAFVATALDGLEPLALLDRGRHLASALRKHLPPLYADALAVLVRSLTPPLATTEGNGLAVFFYLPHVAFVERYGLDLAGNGGDDPFAVSMVAQYEFTRRFSAEFSIRPFLIARQDQTLAQLGQWVRDPDPHVRRLSTEGTRPRLPWAQRIPAFVRDPTPCLPILEALKDDPSQYVRRSVANHVGDIAKDHLDLALGLCERWLDGASDERRWVIRHALRHPGNKGEGRAVAIRRRAG